MIAKLQKLVLGHKLAFALAGAAVLIAFPLVVQSNFIRGIAVRTVLFMLFASSLNLINGYCGHMSIGHAGFMCIGCYTAALLSTKAGLNFWVLLLVSGLVTALFGFLVSLPTLKLSGIYLSIVTLGFSETVSYTHLS